MNSEAATKERRAARQFFHSLSNEEKWQLGDDLVLGEFDWQIWFEVKPSSVFMNELDKERIHWELAA